METYVWETKYDTWNRVQKMTYPDGEEVDYAYNRAGKLQRLTSKKKAHEYVIVDRLGYDKFEQRTFLKLGNGTVTNYTYDPARRWLTHMDVTALLGRKIMDNSYAYDLMSNVLSISNNTSTQALKLGGPATHTFGYDELYRLTEASGQWTGHNREEDYTLLMEYDNLHNIVRKTQTHHRLGVVVAATTYDNQYDYNAAQPHAPTKIGRRNYSYDANGNFTNWKTEGHFSWRQVLWDEENRISAISDNGFVSQYTYDAAGERAIKSSGGVQSVFMNGAPAGFIAHQKNYTAYVSPYLVAKEGRFTKHYFIEGQRIGSRIGTGYFQNRFFGKGLTAGNLNYNVRANLLKQAVIQHYLNLQKPPGVPTAQGHHGDPVTTGIPLPVADFSDSAYSAPPVDWVLPAPPNPLTDPPGVPVPPLVPITNADVKAGYGFNGEGIIHAEANQYFFHPDHLGSTSYVTDVNGEVRQHVEYMPFGETFVDEHSSDGNQPYLFNAKEMDAETGLYYYGARYYDPMASIWASVDPMAEKYAGWSPYNYVLLNPVRLVDPDGQVAFVPILLGIYAVAEFAISAYDSYDAVKTIADPNASTKDKVLSVAGLAIGMLAPGGGYGAGAKQTAKVLDKVGDGVKAADKLADGVKASSKSDELVEVYRVYGGDSKASGYSWTSTDPSTVENFRDLAGLPSGGASGSMNTGQFVIEGTAKKSDILKERKALPLDGNRGGLTELIIDPAKVNVKKISGQNPAF
jgi:RHS repeat-associated protein